MELNHLRDNESEWRRQRTFFHAKKDLSNDILPVVEVEPFKKSVWRTSKSFSREPTMIQPFSSENKKSQINKGPNNYYTGDPRRIYKDTIYLLTELESLKLDELLTRRNEKTDLSFSAQKRRSPAGVMRRSPIIRSAGFAPISERNSFTSQEVEMRRSNTMPAISVKGSSCLPETPKTSPRDHYEYQSSYHISPRRMEKQAWETSPRITEPPPSITRDGTIMINNAPHCVWNTKRGGSSNFPPYSWIKVKDNHAPFSRRINLDPHHPSDNVIMKTFGAPTQGEVALKIGVHRNLSRHKIEQLRMLRKMAQLKRLQEQQNLAAPTAEEETPSSSRLQADEGFVESEELPETVTAAPATTPSEERRQSRPRPSSSYGRSRQSTVVDVPVETGTGDVTIDADNVRQDETEGVTSEKTAEEVAEGVVDEVVKRSAEVYSEEMAKAEYEDGDDSSVDSLEEIVDQERLVDVMAQDDDDVKEDLTDATEEKADVIEETNDAMTEKADVTEDNADVTITEVNRDVTEETDDVTEETYDVTEETYDVTEVTADVTDGSSEVTVETKINLQKTFITAPAQELTPRPGNDDVIVNENDVTEEKSSPEEVADNEEMEPED